jgi:CBS domain-containing protein
MTHPISREAERAARMQDASHPRRALRPGTERRERMACIGNHFVRDVIALEATATCAEAARLMAERGIGSVGVRHDGRLVGLFTERELLAALAQGLDPAKTTLARVVPERPALVSPCATEREAAELMRFHHTRHLAVVENGEIVGVLSLLDLVRLVDQDKQWSIDQLECYIRGGRSGQLCAPIQPVFDRGVTAGTLS